MKREREVEVTQKQWIRHCFKVGDVCWNTEKGKFLARKIEIKISPEAIIINLSLRKLAKFSDKEKNFNLDYLEILSDTMKDILQLKTLINT